MIHERIVHPNDLRACWHWVRGGLERVADKCSEPLMAEDVWASIKTGHSTLYVYDLDGEDIGFTVLQKQSGMDGPVLFVWACYFEPMRYRRHIRELLPFLDNVARGIGAREIRHNSNRMGWAHGGDFVQHSIIWRRVVAAKEEAWEKAPAVAALKP